MTANRPSRPYQAPRPGKPATRDSVAEDLVRSWPPAMRARIRRALMDELLLVWGPTVRNRPERYLVGLIDKVGEEEKVA